MLLITKTNRGITLIEILIVVAILGIIAALAVPSYRDYILKTRRIDATTFLQGQFASVMQDYRIQHATYTTDLQELGLADTNTVTTLNTIQGFYQCSIADATTNCPIATCYVLNCNAIGDQKNDTIATFSLDSTANRTHKVKGEKDDTDGWPD